MHILEDKIRYIYKMHILMIAKAWNNLKIKYEKSQLSNLKLINFDLNGIEF